MDVRRRRTDASAPARFQCGSRAPWSEALERRVLLAVSPAGAEFLVNPPGEGFHATTRQSVATNADGDSVVAWNAADGTNARRYDSAGVALGDVFLVSAGAGGARVAMGSGGEFVVVSSRGYTDRVGIDVVARRYDATGTPQGEEFLVSDQSPRVRQNYSVAMNDAGEFVIAWSSPDRNGLNYQLHAHRYDSSGSSQGGQFLVEAAPYDESIASPSVAIGAEGEFVVAWDGSSRPPPDGRQRLDVYARRYSADGEALGEKFVVNPQPANAGGAFAVMEDDGDFIVAYGANGMHVQRYSAVGVELGDPVFLNAEGTRLAPSFTATGDVGGLIVAWERTIRSGPTRPEVDVDVYAQCFDGTGSPLGDEFLVNTTTAGLQDSASVAVDDEGDFIVAWTSWDAEWNAGDVYARRYVAGVPAASVAGRHVFYNHSNFDGNDDEANVADDNAIAPDKNALLAGQRRLAGFDNIISYDKGINGVMVDVLGLPQDATLAAADFGVNGGPAPASVTVRRGAGVLGSDRVTLLWPDYAIRNGWLRVTVKANGNTGLLSPDVFSFGNLIGETGDDASPLRVNRADLMAVRGRLFSSLPTALTSQYDFNRDGRVNVVDLAIVRRSLGHNLANTEAAAALTVRAAPLPMETYFGDRRSRRSADGLLE